jgi:NitT/TauT family transport system permease protein
MKTPFNGKLNRAATTLAPWFLLIVILGIWQFICSVWQVSDFIFPSPASILQAMVDYAGPITEHALSTFWVTMVGFAIAVFVGVTLGFVIGSSPMLYAAAYPLMTAFNALPKAAFVPVLVVWFGIGAGPAILTAFLISFFPIMVNIATGLATLEPELEDVLRVLGARRMDILLKVGLPRSMPYFFGSLKVAITLAFVGAVVSETVGANKGIGKLMLDAQASFQVQIVFAGLLVLAFLGIVLYGITVIIERMPIKSMAA